jgi:hypothetical protein
MATTYHLEDTVSYLFGDSPAYKVVATKEQPIVRDAGFYGGEVPEGSDYLLVKLPLVAGVIHPYIPVREAHIELIRN